MPLKSQTLEIEAHEIEKKMNELAADIETRAAINTDDPDIATRSTERAALWPELNRKKTELITQLRLEDAEGQAAMAKNADTSGWTPELAGMAPVGPTHQHGRVHAGRGAAKGRRPWHSGA